MASLHIIFDPNDRIRNDPDRDAQVGLKTARLSIPSNLESVDIYNLARKLSELLLEQLPH
jgi:hypothetical protein